MIIYKYFLLLSFFLVTYNIRIYYDEYRECGINNKIEELFIYHIIVYYKTSLSYIYKHIYNTVETESC